MRTLHASRPDIDGCYLFSGLSGVGGAPKVLEDGVGDDDNELTAGGSIFAERRRWRPLGCHQVAQHVGEDAAVLVVGGLVCGIDPAE